MTFSIGPVPGPIPLPASALAAPAHRAAIHRCPVFFNLGPNDLDAAVALAHPRYFNKRQPIYRQGEPGLHLFLLREGQVKLTRVSIKGEESVLWVLQEAAGAGMSAGDGSSNGHALVPSPRSCLFGAIETGSYSCTAIPTTPISVLEWNRDQILLRLPHLAARLGEHSACRLRELEQRLCEMATCSVPYRLATALLRLQAPDGTVHLQREEMAQHVGSTLFTISRCMSEWARLGLVAAKDRERFKVIDAAGLRKAVE